jgi:uncharacterized protein with GYD domain
VRVLIKEETKGLEVSEHIYVMYDSLTPMSFYIILWNFTEQGIKSVKESPKRADAFKNLLERAGGKLHSTYYTCGKYDGVSIVEAPNDESIMSTLLSIESEGNARTITLKAFTYEEGTKIISSL